MTYAFDTDSVAIVTGGSSGIGAAIVSDFVRNGVNVVFCGRDSIKGARFTDKLSEQNHKGTANYFNADISLSDDITKLVAHTIKLYGKVNFLINNAALPGPTEYNAQFYPEEAWDALLNVNLKAPWLCIKYTLEYLLKESNSAIVNIGSYSGLKGSRNALAYNVSKHGLVGLTKSVAIEYAAQNLRVNLISPGIITTPMSEKIYGEHTLAQAKYLHPMRRLGNPEEIAKATMWLCSKDAAFITGSILSVDGGMLI